MRASFNGRPVRIRSAGPAPGTLVIGLVIVALVAGTCATPAPSPSPSASPAPSVAPSGTAGPSPTRSPSPTASPDPWTAVTLPAVAEVATLEPVAFGEDGVAPTSGFRLTSRDGTPVGELASRLTVTPAVQLVAGRPDGASVIVTPARALAGGEVYRFTLGGGDGEVLASWAMAVATPPRIVGTLPADRATRVPVNTGIELTFDQRGITAADLEDHWRIEPAVRGRFEVEGRVAAFVPDALTRDTLYTITVTKGLPLRGTGLSLAEDVVFRFETGAPDAARQPVVTFRRALSDASTTERPSIPVRVDRDDDTAPAADTVNLVVHRLASMRDAIAAYRAVRTAPDWTTITGTTPIATEGLTEVLRADVPLRTFGPVSDDDDPGDRWILVPETLPAGWYVVAFAHRGVPRQAVLQVTDLATFALVSVTRTAVWVNDVRSASAVDGATVSIGSTSLGSTGADGLLVATTPDVALATGAWSGDTVAVVRDGTRTAFAPVQAPYACGKCEPGVVDLRPDRWWTLVSSDRDRYRTSDTATVWGVVRDRDAGTVPQAVEVRLVPDDGSGRAAPPVTATRVAPNGSGAFLASLAFADLPPGDYSVSVVVGGREVASTWMSVGPISKPAYAIDVTVSPRAVIVGSEVTVTARAAFFEGTPVAGLELRFGDEDNAVTATTDANGTASVRMRMGASEDQGQLDFRYVGVRPVAPEEAEIGGGAGVAVFGASAVLGAQATVAGTQLTVTGTLNEADLAAFEVPGADSQPWEIDATGAPRADGAIRVQVTEQWGVQRRVGTAYDFITKRTEPVYETDWQERDLGTRTVRSAADGTYRMTWTAIAGRSYEVTASYTDEGGRTIGADASGFSSRAAVDEGHRLWLTEVDPLPDGDREYGIGDTIHLQLLGGRGERTSADRYLYAVAQRGLRYAVVGTGSRFRTTFTERSVPDLWITGVRFTGRAYEVDLDGYHAAFRSEERRLSVELAADRAGYAPGDEVTLTVRTREPGGRGVPASVFVRVVDEKLYAIGAASDADPLDDLYVAVASGVTSVAWTHRSAEPEDDDGKGDTTGGGRDDFRDWLFARLVDTDTSGSATVRFGLSDDLTSWHVAASGVDAGLRAGLGTLRLPVSLPFFVEATVAPEYLVADRPVIRVRGYGAALQAGAPVTFRVSSASLGLDPATVTGTAFTAVEVPLPALRAGTHRIEVTATTGIGRMARTDTVVRTISVVETRSVRRMTTSEELTAGLTVGSPTGTGPTLVTIADSGRGRFVPLLRDLAAGGAGRADRVLAAALAARVLEDAFDLPAEAAPAGPDDLLQYQEDSGVSLLPYASPDLRLTVLAALSGDTRLSTSRMREFLDEILDEAEGRTREERILALTGLAALGDAVLGDVREAAALADLGAWERVALAAAALALGDDPLARALLRAELAAHGQRLGPWVRLRVTGDDEDSVLTGWLLMVAGSLGDPITLDLDAYLAENPPRLDLVDLQRAIAARGWAARTPGEEAVVAWTVDGVRREEAIPPGGAFELSVTPAQRATLRLDPVRGSAIVSASWDAPAATVPVQPAEGMRFERRVAPAGAVRSSDLVVVTFDVALGADPFGDCWRVTDLAPSGLVPLAASRPWEEDEDELVPGWVGPWRIVGQRVDFCVSHDPRQPVRTLRYVARVVTPGTYAWEAAVLQSPLIPSRGMLIPASELVIRGLPG